MIRYVAIIALACWFVATTAGAQGIVPEVLGAPLGGFAGARFSDGSFPVGPVEIAQPNSATAKLVQESLDLAVELGDVETTLGELDEWLTEKVAQVVFFVDTRGLAFAELSDDTLIAARLPKLPLRSALRRLLRPYSLRVVVEEEGLVITADFAELARRSIATDVWVDQDIAAQARIRKTLQKRLSVDLRNLPLDQAVGHLGEVASIPMVLDRRALAEGGIPIRKQLGLRIKNAKLQTVLKLILRKDGLAYRINNEVLEVTTQQAAEQALLTRIYFLEATGFLIGDSDSVSTLIQTSILPETWANLGGLSTIGVISQGQRSRPALLVATTADVHDRIESLLRAMRQSHVGADPQVTGTF